MFTFLKGVLIGLGKILPGISGSLIAISMGIYDKLIKIISELKIKQNIIFLIEIGLGIIIGISLGSKVIYYFLNNYYLYTMSVIIGVLISMIFGILKKEKPNCKKDYIILFISFFLVFILDKIKGININHNYIIVILLGFIDALTMIIPGISGTAIFMILGVYDFVLVILSNLFNHYIIFFGIGLILGIFITVRIVAYLLDNHHKKFYLIIEGFSIASLFLIIKLISFSFLPLLFIAFGFIFGLFFNKD